MGSCVFVKWLGTKKDLGLSSPAQEKVLDLEVSFTNAGLLKERNFHRPLLRIKRVRHMVQKIQEIETIGFPRYKNSTLIVRESRVKYFLSLCIFGALITLYGPFLFDVIKNLKCSRLLCSEIITDMPENIERDWEYRKKQRMQRQRQFPKIKNQSPEISLSDYTKKRYIEFSIYTLLAIVFFGGHIYLAVRAFRLFVFHNTFVFDKATNQLVHKGRVVLTLDRIKGVVDETFDCGDSIAQRRIGLKIDRDTILYIANGDITISAGPRTSNAIAEYLDVPLVHT